MNSKHCPFCSKEIGPDENVCVECRVKINPHCAEAQNQPSTGESANTESQPMQQQPVQPTYQNNNFVDKTVDVIDALHRPRHIGGGRLSSLEAPAYFVLYVIALVLIVGIDKFLGNIGGAGGFTFNDFLECMIFSFILTFVLYVRALISSSSEARTLLVIFLILHVILLFIV